MIRILGHNVQTAILLLGLGDVALGILCFYIGYFGRYAELSAASAELMHYAPNAALYAGVLVLSMFAVGVYENDAVADQRLGLVRLGASFIMAFLLLAGVIYLIPDLMIWRSGLGIALPLTLAAMVGSRMMFLRVAVDRAFSRRVLVIGDPQLVGRIHEIARSSLIQTFEVAGSVALQHLQPEQDDPLWLYRLARSRNATEIVVAAHERRGRLPLRELIECRLGGLRVTEYHDFCERETGRVDLDRMKPAWLIFSDGFASSRLDLIGKRLFDVVAALLVLTLTLPLLIVAALAVRLEDGGPVFYRQIRVGHNARPFELLKFRSMRVDAEKHGAQWAQANDPRVTRVGWFLRRTRIDELPQIINVLKGEMSVVGPRPERPVFVAELAAELPYFHERHRLKPGISGWAQLNHHYAASVDDARTKLEYDMYYLKNWSLLFDFLILAQTFRVVIWGQGAR